jgi:hypothetical protein
MTEPKIVITGTGRAGTTLLVQVLDALGLDTGLGEGKLTPYGPGVRAGLECRIDDPAAPTVVKDITLGFRMRAVLESRAVPIAHVVIPTRRLDIAAASRIRASAYGRLPFRRGALTGTLRPMAQQQVLATVRGEMIDALDDFAVPYTELDFPRFATDAEYTHETLGFLVPGATVHDFRAALDQCVRPELIHESPLSPREVSRARLMTSWMVLVRYPVARLRGRLDPEGSKRRLREAVVAARQKEALLVEQEHSLRREPPSS